MATIRVNIVKVKYKFEDNEVQGIEMRLAPKVKKFVLFNKDNLDLMNLVGNGLAEWYVQAEFGDDIELKLDLQPKNVKVVDTSSGSEKIDTSGFWD